LEKPEIELEQGLALLEEGVKLHQECQQLLNQTQVKITKLLDAQAEPEMSAVEPQVKSETAEATLFESEDGLPF
jgi:exodeoxyribonuclease VII small subunit